MAGSEGGDQKLLDEDHEAVHGGDLDAARRRFPGAPEPFIDLSTGINPYPYPLPRLAANMFARLPSPRTQRCWRAAAARAYGARSEAHVVAMPGTQIVLPVVARLVPPGRAAVLHPGYAEHARAAALAGHRVQAIGDLGDADDATLVIVANPNNPDGRRFVRTIFLHSPPISAGAAACS